MNSDEIVYKREGSGGGISAGSISFSVSTETYEQKRNNNLYLWYVSWDSVGYDFANNFITTNS